jgi:Holliday junction resolvase RusA-like endonuclease
MMNNYEFGILGYAPIYANEPVKAIEFVIHGEPMSKQRPRFNPKSGRAYTPAQTRNSEREISERYVETNAGVFEGAIGIEIQFFMGTKRRKDIDNLVKTVLDALNGIAFTDDHLVHVLSAVKFFSTPDKARTVVKIFQIDSITFERND